jgi:hypothetical protein
MSRRTFDSTAHQKRISKFLVTDDDLFEYVSNATYRKAADGHFSIDMCSAYRRHWVHYCKSLADTDFAPLQPPELSHTAEDRNDPEP